MRALLARGSVRAKTHEVEIADVGFADVFFGAGGAEGAVPSLVVGAGGEF